MPDIYSSPEANLTRPVELENSSGMGKEVVITDGVKGWSWGAFMFNWIWAIGNKTWIGLFAVLPYVGFPFAIMLGIKGREWAWRNKRWDSVEHFQSVQRKWSLWSFAFVAVALIGIVAAIGLPAFQNDPVI